MYCILLEFTPISGKEEEFLKAWEVLTEYIFQNYGSKGSRMHRNESGKFIAYAQWPSKEMYESVTSTSEGDRLRETMRSYLEKGGVKVLEKLEVLEDHLKG